MLLFNSNVQFRLYTTYKPSNSRSLNWTFNLTLSNLMVRLGTPYITSWMCLIVTTCLSLTVYLLQPPEKNLPSFFFGPKCLTIIVTLLAYRSSSNFTKAWIITQCQHQLTSMDMAFQCLSEWSLTVLLDSHLMTSYYCSAFIFLQIFYWAEISDPHPPPPYQGWLFLNLIVSPRITKLKVDW